MFRPSRSTSIALAASLLAAIGMSAANAAPLSTAELMGEYNLIVLGDAQASSETEGTVYVGGNLTGGGPYGVNPDSLANGSLGGTLVVGGSLFGEVRLFSGDAVLGAVSGTLYNNGGGTVTTGATVDTAAVAAAALQFSAELADLSGTGGSITGGQNAVFNSVAGPDDVAVFNIDSSFFSGVSNLNFNTGGLTTVINVAGENVSLGGGFNFNGSFSDVIFNFYEATSLTLSTAFGASILAPLAEATINSGRTQGSVLVGSLLQTVEIDGQLFDGEFPVSEVPLPAGVVLMLTGLAGLFAAKGRKRV